MTNKKIKRATALKIAMILFIVIGVLQILINISNMFGQPILILSYFLNHIVVFIPVLPFQILRIINIAEISFCIILALRCISSKNRRTFNAYFILFIVEAALSLIRIFPYILSNGLNFMPSLMFPFILKGAILYAVYMLDVKHFEEE